MVYDYSEKADFRKCCWNPKRNLGLTTQFGNKVNKVPSLNKNTDKRIPSN